MKLNFRNLVHTDANYSNSLICKTWDNLVCYHNKTLGMISRIRHLIQTRYYKLLNICWSHCLHYGGVFHSNLRECFFLCIVKSIFLSLRRYNDIIKPSLLYIFIVILLKFIYFWRFLDNILYFNSQKEEKVFRVAFNQYVLTIGLNFIKFIDSIPENIIYFNITNFILIILALISIYWLIYVVLGVDWHEFRILCQFLSRFSETLC